MPQKFLKIKNRNRFRFLKNAKNKFYSLAKASDVRCNHACIIFNRRTGEIIAEGHNYHYHKKCVGTWTKVGSWSMHAEEDAYRKFLKIYKRYKHRPNDIFDLIVVRKEPNGKPGYKMSKPCSKCKSKLQKLKKKSLLGKIYHSIDSSSDELSDSIVEDECC